MNKDPLVSIIVNCFNGEKYLDQSLKSVLEQTYKNWEIIFWDNISTDKSKKIFEKYSDERFKYFKSNQHCILYHARNQAIKEAKGDLIAFLDTDDIWLNDKLQKQVKLFSDERVGLVYGNYWRYNIKNFFQQKRLASSKTLPTGLITNSLLKKYQIGMLTVMLRKRYLEEKKDVFNTNFDMLSDMDFVLKFSKKYRFDCVQEPIAIYRQHDEQLQNKNLEKQVSQMLDWYKKLRNSNEFGSEEKLKVIKNKYKFLQIVQYINQKLFFKSLKEIILYPNNFQKIKLFLLLILPKNITEKFIDFR